MNPSLQGIPASFLELLQQVALSVRSCFEVFARRRPVFEIRAYQHLKSSERVEWSPLRVSHYSLFCSCFSTRIRSPLSVWLSTPVTALVVGQVFQKGYQVGETLVRPAMVAVAVPA